jgi:hypothetical protein
MARKTDPKAKEQALAARLEASKQKEQELLMQLIDTRHPPLRAARLAVERAQTELCKLQDNSPQGRELYNGIMSNLHRAWQLMRAVGIDDIGPRSDGELAEIVRELPPDVVEELKKPNKVERIAFISKRGESPTEVVDVEEDDDPEPQPVPPAEAMSLRRHMDDDGDNMEEPS